MTAVEIDKEMIALARKYMDLDHLKVSVVQQDAFEFISSESSEVDVIIDDLYHARGDDVERPEGVTPTYLDTLRDHLCPWGSLVMNFVVGPGHDTVFQEACSAFKSCFQQSRRIIPPNSHNEALVGSNHPAALATPSRLLDIADRFTSEQDRGHWKELRTLKLR